MPHRHESLTQSLGSSRHLTCPRNLHRHSPAHRPPCCLTLRTRTPRASSRHRARWSHGRNPVRKSFQRCAGRHARLARSIGWWWTAHLRPCAPSQQNTSINPTKYPRNVLSRPPQIGRNHRSRRMATKILLLVRSHVICRLQRLLDNAIFPPTNPRQRTRHCRCFRPDWSDRSICGATLRTLCRPPTGACRQPR